MGTKGPVYGLSVRVWLLAALGMTLFFPTPARAETIHVDCDVTELVNAITTANASPGADTLDLSAGCLYRLTAINNTSETLGPNGLPVITGELVLNGNGAIITRADEASKFRFFQVQNTAALTLNRLILKKGELEPASVEQSAYHGGAIYNLGNLTLTDSVLENSWAHEAGGGIYNDGGTVTTSRSTFSNNGENGTVVATVSGGAVYSRNGTVTINASEFKNNHAAYDGGAIHGEGTLHVTNTRFVGNRVELEGGYTGGGAVSNSGVLMVITSTFDGNSAQSYGGALYIQGTSSVSQSTFVHNHAYGAHGSGGGGAIYGGSEVSNSTFYENFAGYYALGAAIQNGGTVVNSTFASNRQEGDSAIPTGIQGATLKNSIVYDTVCTDIVDGGGNLYWPKSIKNCPGQAANPRLGLLRENGGPTPTMAPGVDSAALDAAVEADCPESDQRGISRPQNDRCDIGAFELELQTIDQVDRTVTFGRWRTVNLGGADTRISNHKADAVTFVFKGRKIKWVARRGPEFGKAQVTIDGKDKGIIDLYAPFPLFDRDRTFTFPKLGTGKHRLVIRVLGEKNSAATDSYVALDRFVVAGKTTLPNSPRVTLADWRGKKEPAAIGGTYRSSTLSNARAEFVFEGPGLDWVTATGPAYGKAKVYIDGTQRGGIWDLYSPTQRWGIVIPFGGLSEGQHTFVLVVLGKRNLLSSGTTVILDAFRLPLLPRNP